ncbi:virulence factor SrfB [Enterobacter hormaechei]
MPAGPRHRSYPEHQLCRAGESHCGDGVLNVRLKLRGGTKQEGPESFELSDAWLQDGTPVPPDALTLKPNTLADRRHSGSHYWIDSGSVYLK